MGMCLTLRSVSDKNINLIISSPPLVWRLIAPDEPEMYIDCINEDNRGFLAKLFGTKKTTEVTPVPELDFIEGENIEDDLDKSWQGIHYCLNQTEYEAEHPMDFITLGGKLAGDIDVGYGPARLINSSTVKEIDAILSETSEELLRDNYNPIEMDRMDIYPSIWERDGDEGFDYILENFKRLKEFVSSCSKNNLGMALYLC